MSRPNSKGAGVCGTNAPGTCNNQLQHFANDDGASKALATMKARAGSMPFHVERDSRT